jgi:recombinational DNA repair ATPase RecF
MVRDYKSITDSGGVPFSPAVTCLVGKNESGKTAFLEATYRWNPVPTGHHERLVRLNTRRGSGDADDSACP